MNLLSRNEFRNKVFERDNHICVIPGCGKKAVDAHHIIERRLWQEESEFGGYYINNGASLCEEHHIAAEKNFFPPRYLWELIGAIGNTPRPKSFIKDVDYNKWGIPFKMPNRYRIKYPTTPYLPMSPQWRPSGSEKDDEGFLENIDCFLGAPLVFTIKKDGSNVQLTKEHVAARNGVLADHKSFDYLKALHAQKYSHMIPEQLQIFGEWLYAKHSIHYTGDLALRNYLQIFGVYNSDTKMWGSWKDVMAMSWALQVPTVPVLMVGTFNEEWRLAQVITKTAEDIIRQGHEGIVIRIDYPFHYGQFSDHIAKYVRPNHVQTDEHWSKGPIVRNVEKQNII